MKNRINNTLFYDNNSKSGYGCNVTNVNGNICTSTKRSDIPGNERLICKTNVPLTRYVRKLTFN